MPRGFAYRRIHTAAQVARFSFDVDRLLGWSEI